MPFDLNAYKVHIPHVWENDWSAIDDAQGAERDVLVTQRLLANLLRAIGPSQASPENLAWLSLWGRFYAILSAGLGCLDRGSPLGMRVLERHLFEACVQLEAAIGPLIRTAEAAKKGEQPATSSPTIQVRERLRALFAWSVWNDIRFYEHLLRPDNLDATFDLQPRRELTEILGPLAEQWEHDFHQELRVSDQERAQDRLRAEEHSRDRLDRYRAWLADARIAGWATRLQEAKVKSYYDLIGVGRTLNEALRRRGLGFAYARYMQGSAALHGSSFEAVLFTVETTIFTEFFDVTNRLEAELRDLADVCRLQALALRLALSAATDPGSETPGTSGA